MFITLRFHRAGIIRTAISCRERTSHGKFLCGLISPLKEALTGFNRSQYKYCGSLWFVDNPIKNAYV